MKSIGEWYSCPEELVWTPEEEGNEELRRCKTCRKVCEMLVNRVIIFNPLEVQNFCSRGCYEREWERK